MKSACTSNKRLHVLFCILNWGLGHASRSIPIIKALQNRGFDVELASDGRAAELLKKEFPDLNFYEAPKYGVRYPFKSMRKNILLQWPQIARAMWKEHYWLKGHIDDHDYDVIISDNRYGCWSSDVHSVMITHQLAPPTEGAVTNKIAADLTRLMLKRFDQVWIPDDEQLRYSGSMTQNPPDHAKFIGFVSRLYPENKIPGEHGLIIISGPEPQRSHFEDQLKTQVIQNSIRCKLVKGVTEGTSIWRVEDGIETCDFLTSVELQSELNRASWVVSRSGYTSLMDYEILGIGALMIPTPGQYEQELLAKTIKKDGWEFTDEDNLNLVESLEVLGKSKAKPYLNKDLALALDQLEERISKG